VQRKQRGVAVVVAVLVVALATSTASYVLWHQSLWVRQVENLTARAQADVIARAAAHWSAAILSDDDRAVDHLGEVWAQRIPPFAAETAELSGLINDEQAKFNVNNLIRDGAPSPTDLVAFQRLLVALGLPPSLAETLVDWLDSDDAVTQPGGAEDLYYLALDPPYRAANRRIVEIAELVRVKGFTPQVVGRLAPHITALPMETAVNVNTASAAVLQAMLPSLGAADVAAIIESRKARAFRDRSEIARALPKQNTSTSIDATIDVKSRFFAADLTVRLGRATVGYRALFDRGDRGAAAVVGLSQIAL
jgi:general secretion pathway protein K